MKKILFPTLMAAIFFTAISFTNHRNHLIKTPNDWGEWVNDDCFQGIDYRVRKGDFNTYDNRWYWYVQFRNRYRDQVHFSYAVDEPGTHPEPDHRDNMEAGSVSDGKGFLLYNSSRIHVRVGYIRFGDDDSGQYANCDK